MNKSISIDITMVGSKLVSGHPCKYADNCNLRSIAMGCGAWDLNPENCSIYKLMEDVEDLKNKVK